jgi:hypothetical protein
MVEIGIAEYFDMGAALGIIGTMFVVLYLLTLVVIIHAKKYLKQIDKGLIKRPYWVSIISLNGNPSFANQMITVNN